MVERHKEQLFGRMPLGDLLRRYQEAQKFAGPRPGVKAEIRKKAESALKGFSRYLDKEYPGLRRAVDELRSLGSKVKPVDVLAAKKQIIEEIEDRQKKEQALGAIDDVAEQLRGSVERGAAAPREGKNKQLDQKRLALAILKSPLYERLKPRERAAVRRLAEIGATGVEEETPFVVLSQMSEIYAREVERLKEEHQGEIEKKFGKGTPFGIVFDLRETASQDEILAAIFHSLISGIYNRHFSQEEIDGLKKDLLFLSTTGDNALYAGVSGFTMAVINLIDYWRNDFTGEEGAKVGTKGATAGALEKLNGQIEFLFADPRVCLSWHTASTQGLGDVRFSQELRIRGENEKELEAFMREANSGDLQNPLINEEERYAYVEGFSPELSEDEKRRKLIVEILKAENPEEKNKRIAREMADVAYDILGDMLHQITLKVRADPLQAGAYVYSVYKTDQPGWQFGRGKYDALHFKRLLHQEEMGYRARIGEPVLLWGNGMHTLFTLAVHGELVSKWRELLDQSDKKGSEINIGLRNKAALISWWGEYDFRLPGIDALDFEAFLACKDRDAQKKMYEHFKKIFDGYSESQQKRIIRGNLARARTTREWRETTTGKKEWRYTLEPIIDLDAVWFNRKTKRWEYCIDPRWFLEEGKSRVDMVWVYEGYKQRTAELVTAIIKGKSDEDYQNRFKVLNALLSEDSFKEHYATPEYRGWVASHLIERTLYEELEPVLHQARYAGERGEFLTTARRFSTWLEYHLNQQLHFNAANIEGNWKTILEVNASLARRERLEVLLREGKIKEEMVAGEEIPIGRRLRQVMMENSCVGVWEVFARNYGLSLEDLLTFAGLKEVGRKKVTVKIGNRESGFEEREYEYLLLDYLNLREVKVSERKSVRVLDRVNDDPHAEGTEWKKRMDDLVASEKKEGVYRLSHDLAEPEGNDWRLLTPLDLLRLTRKLIYQYEEATEYFDRKGKRKEGNWYDAGNGLWMFNFYKSTQRINAITREAIVPLGWHRGKRLWRGWDPVTEKPIPDQTGISPVRNLYGGWWEFGPELGLSEAFPYWSEEEMVTFFLGRYTTPYRRHVAYRMSDVEYGDETGKKAEEITDNDRRTSRYKHIFIKNLRKEYRLAMGPDGCENIFAILSIIGTAREPGKSIIDSKPARRYQRLTGSNDPDKVNRYRQTAIFKLNVVPIAAPGNPDQIKIQQQKVADKLQKQVERLKNVVAVPGQWGELVMSIAGVDLESMAGGGGVEADNGYQAAYALAGGGVVGAVTFFTFAALYTNLVLTLPLFLVGTPAAAMIGYAMGTDVDRTDLDHFYVFKIPDFIPIIGGKKVKAPFITLSSVVRWQEEGWLPSVRRTRLRRQREYQFPQTLLKPEFLAEMIKEHKEQFAVGSPPKGGK